MAAKDDKSKQKKIDSSKIKKGSFHEWLGKEEGALITEDDINRGLKSDDPHVRKMANFARNAKHFKHPKKGEKGKIAKEDFAEAPAWANW